MLCGSCLPGGPAVVTVVEAAPPVDVAEVLVGIAGEPEPDEIPPPPAVGLGVTLRGACRIDEIDYGSTRRETEAARTLLLARGWKRRQVHGKMWSWFEPAPYKRAT